MGGRSEQNGTNWS